MYSNRNRAYTPNDARAAILGGARPASKPKSLKARMVTPQTGARTPASESTSQVAVSAVDGSRNNAHAFLLTDLHFKPLYANEAAISVLNFGGQEQPALRGGAVAQRIRAILQADRFTPGLPGAEFVSGRRVYVCRPHLLESRDGRNRSPMVVLLLERHAREQLPLSEVSRQFHLSPRECETIRHLTQGLTTKEVAQQMSVSPNTVKQFVRLIMSKMGATTRTGIVGKMVAG